MAKFVLIISFLSLTAHAAIDQQAHEYVLCKNAEEVRAISVTLAKNKACTALYSKRGTEEVIARSSKPEDCHGHVARLRDVLTAANFSCRDVQHAEITSSSEAETK